MNALVPIKQTMAVASRSMRAAWQKFFPAAGGKLQGEQGDRVDAETALHRLYARMWIDTERRELVQMIRTMDREDGRVKRIHSKLARDCIRGGLVLQVKERHSSEVLKREWSAFLGRLQLDNVEKLKSDGRGLVMEGNLPLQLLFDSTMNVVAGVRMPSETIQPMTDLGGRFQDPAKAFEQRDVMTGRTIGSWAAWQMVMARLDPDNFDDLGSMGRPFLDSCAKTWRKLTMTEEDLVIRRRMRAPLRLAHVLEGATDDDLAKYRQDHEAKQGEITTDFYLNRKGGVQPVQGDSTLGEITDVVHLLDSFYAGGPAPKALFGYTDGLNRDILEDLKRDYYDEVDGLQDCQASAYAIAFRMHLLFKGVDPDPDEFTLRFAQRRTDTPNQVADLALKYMALGIPWEMIWSNMGMDPDFVLQKLAEQAKRTDPYPLPSAGGGQAGAKVSVTPGNAPKQESSTSISNAGGNGGRGRA
ncbi:hypothetical protein [Ramlibacter sp.]|uniref:hypothetical protein n=1 Tax=Ramlibacter sp. TaxID=1917967 RepID=UPI003D0E10F9